MMTRWAHDCLSGFISSSASMIRARVRDDAPGGSRRIVIQSGRGRTLQVAAVQGRERRELLLSNTVAAIAWLASTSAMRCVPQNISRPVNRSGSMS